MKNSFLVLVLLSSSTLFAQEWISDLGVALKEAQRQDKKVFLYFSISDACEVCQRLEKNVLLTDDFLNYARDNYIFVQPDFNESVPLSSKADNLLVVEKYNKDGFFPLVVILDKNSKVIATNGLYNNEKPTEYIALLETLQKGK